MISWIKKTDSLLYYLSLIMLCGSGGIVYSVKYCPHLFYPANAAATYYGYYMLPDGTFCLAPPPPGIDASAYYSSMPPGVMGPATASEASPNLGTTPSQSETVAVAAAAPAPAPSQVAVSAAPAVLPETR